MKQHLVMRLIDTIDTMFSAAMNLHGDFRRQRSGLSVESPTRGDVRPLGALCGNSVHSPMTPIRSSFVRRVWYTWKKTIVQNRLQHAAASDLRIQACIMQRIPAFAPRMRRPPHHRQSMRRPQCYSVAQSSGESVGGNVEQQTRPLRVSSQSTARCLALRRRVTKVDRVHRTGGFSGGVERAS
jgi:hypothetical protein